jgi:hypothetical protein
LMPVYGRILQRTLILALVATVACGCEWDYSIWIQRKQSADPLYRFIENDKAGYIDQTGRVAVPPTLRTYGNSGEEFHNGFLSAFIAPYIDTTGKDVFDGLEGGDFSEGLALARRAGEKVWGYIDTAGQFVISPRFESDANNSVSSFSGGLALIETHGKTGFIDRSAVFVIKPQFLAATDFSDGMARVVAEGPCVLLPQTPCASLRVLGADERGSGQECKFAFIDKAGRIVSPLRFDDAGDFSEGLAAVRIADRWGYVDKSGQLVIPPQFQYAGEFSSGRAPVVVDQDGGFGYTDRSGNIVIDPQFDEAERFSEGLAVVGDGDDRYWYINPQGDKVFAEDFATASPFFKGLAHVELISNDDIDRYAYIDHAGRHVFAYVGTR